MTGMDACANKQEEQEEQEDWIQNMKGFASTFEDEGILGIAQFTLVQTTNIATSIASSTTMAVWHVVTGASTNAGQLLTGNLLSDSSDRKQFADEADENLDCPRCGDDATPFVLRIAMDMLGALPLLNFGNADKNMNHSQRAMERKLIKADVESCSSSLFYDADSCDESIYYDAPNTIHTDATSSFTSPSPTEESCNDDVNDQPVPTSIVFRESPTFYIDMTNMISEFDHAEIPLAKSPVDNANLYAICGGDEGLDSFHSMLDVLVNRSLKIATVDGLTATTVDQEFHWKVDGHTNKILQRHSIHRHEEWSKMLESEVLKWTSSIRSHDSNSDTPMLRTQGVIDMTPSNLKDLLLDCKRVRLFNKHSLGKEDLCTFPNVESGEAKIVKHEIRIPVVGGTIQSLFLTHSRCIENGGFIIISQSVKRQFNDTISSPFYSISILRPVPNSDKTELTNITQISSMPIPKFLMQKVGFMGADDLFKNLRALCKQTGV
mmetsp:Transcript_35251/g.74438  ORF Transcript_35251/g.74438 Transcript_35251/m.74438 type:complete len:492 (-) Transcript_35251:44-1519(-)